WGGAIMWLGWSGYFGGVRQRILVGALAVVVGVGFTGLLFAGKVGPYVADSALAQYLTPNTAARLGIGASVLSGYAAHEREHLVRDSLRVAAAEPLAGHGLGYTDEWQFSTGPHDRYLLFLVEGGVVGAALYLGLVFLLWRYSMGVGRVVALELIVAGFFTHNQLEQPAFLLLMAFVVAHGAMTRAGMRTRSGVGLIRTSV
ncbi:MAG: hypothetical protein P8180_11990, partial [Gammaproteobacteria bacterium]